MFSPSTIQRTTGAPLANIETTWPATVQALQWAGIDTCPVEIAAIATISVETGVFLPIPEEGDYDYFLREFGSPYEAQYHGRGTIQCSWSYNYKHYGDLIGLDLLNNPDLALRQDVAAKVLALYFKEHGVASLASASEWVAIRRAVNGGTNGLTPYLAVVSALVAAPPDTPPVTRLAVDAHLQAEPKDDSHVVADLKAGCVINFNRPDGRPFGITPHWARCQITKGITQKLKDAKGLMGWLKRAELQTTGG